ncbi:hypothetical protein ACHAW5_010179 [Stephanodiscus triporus]|uniref:Uncharacterized protein n=1 Tax=Stephanodiscus triporus TaxID=2934178 RepID=A0ABD3PMY3_9STRA
MVSVIFFLASTSPLTTGVMGFQGLLGCGRRHDINRGQVPLPPRRSGASSVPVVVRPRPSSSSSSSSSLPSSSPSVDSSASPESSSGAATTTTAPPSAITHHEIRSLFRLLSDDVVLRDPSSGTCCRNGCSGCKYLDPVDGNFLYDEFVASSSDGRRRDDDDDDDDDDVGEILPIGGWLAPYVVADFGNRVHASAWGKILFPREGRAAAEGWADDDRDNARRGGGELERERFASLMLGASSAAAAAGAAGGERGGGGGGTTTAVGISQLALKSLWDVLSPVAGYPRLSSSDVSRAIRGLEGSEYGMGGAANYDAFARGMIDASDRIVRMGGSDVEFGEFGDRGATLDYDSMDKEELLEVCASRGMTTSFPKMKRIIIEELRFYDANGRQGKRHPVKNTLS